MQSSGNTELDAVIRMLPADRARAQKKQRRKKPKRWAVVRWVPTVELFQSRRAAQNYLDRVVVSRWAGLVDCETGKTWADKRDYRTVITAVRRQTDNAPERFERVAGVLKIRMPSGP